MNTLKAVLHRGVVHEVGKVRKGDGLRKNDICRPQGDITRYRCKPVRLIKPYNAVQLGGLFPAQIEPVLRYPN